jgi:4-aminobutyrate aminotransferase-like enzyme
MCAAGRHDGHRVREERRPLQPDADTCIALMNACAKRDLVVINAGTEKNIIRVL